MEKLNKDTFDAFYNENISVLNPSFVGNHQFKQDAFFNWKRRFKDAISIQQNVNYNSGGETSELFDALDSFLEQFSPQYISFLQFAQAMETLVNELFDDLILKTKPDTVVLFLPEKVEKSGLWVVMVAWPFIKRRINEDAFEFFIALETNINWIEERLKGRPERSLVTMLFDDATYSGNQYSKQTLKYAFQKQKFMESYGTWTHAVMIPYISKLAEEKIAGTNRLFGGGAKLWFPSSVHIMPSVNGPDVTIPYNSIYFPIFDNKYDGVFNRGMTYFDHKLADNVSIYTFIMKNAPVPDTLPVTKMDMQIGPSFIEQCGPSSVLVGQEKDTVIDNAGHLKPDCFVPPYKRHNWTYNGRNVDKNKTLVQIASQCMVCQRVSAKLYREHGTPESEGYTFCGRACQAVLHFRRYVH